MLDVDQTESANPSATASGEASLPCMGADASTITISGHSAGCYMSERLMIMHSDKIHGAGLFQCFPFGVPAEDVFMVKESAFPPSVLSAHSISKIDESEAAGEIAATTNL